MGMTNRVSNNRFENDRVKRCALYTVLQASRWLQRFTKMTNEEIQVRKFYELIWSQHNHKVIPEVLHGNIRFRGSLGLTQYGHSEFKAYLDMVHEALGKYQCIIDDLVCEPNKVFTWMTFTGIHKGEFMGFPPTDKRVTWSGAALFTFAEGKVADLWVLGDLISLERQLKEGQT